MALIYYKNRTTRKIVFIIATEKTMVQVMYVPSRMRCWYMHHDFERLFKKIL